MGQRTLVSSSITFSKQFHLPNIELEKNKKTTQVLNSSLNSFYILNLTSYITCCQEKRTKIKNAGFMSKKAKNPAPISHL